MPPIFQSSRRSRRLRQSQTPEGQQEQQTPFFDKSDGVNDAQGKPQPFFQAKLAIGQPGDPYEREADAVADAVVNHKGQAPVVQRQEISTVQRESLAAPQEEEPVQMQTTGEEEEPVQMQAEEEEEPVQMQTMGEEEEPVQMQAEEEEEPVQMQTMGEEEEPVQMKANSGKAATNKPVGSRLKDTAGKGEPLPMKTRAEMENSFGVDFSQVNIHTDGEAVQLNKDLGAHAFTHGKDVYFNAGKYNPDNSSGKHLLAHELTHVVQQQGGSKAKQTLKKTTETNTISLKNNNQTTIPRTIIQLAPDTDQCELDWNSGLYDAQKHRFHGSDRPKGTDKERYDKLCPLYKSRGIPSPLKYIQDNIRQASFFGFKTPAHKDMVGKLANAESILKGMNITTVPLTKVWAFNARTTSEGTWSNHASGKAIDFDSHLNPHLTNKTHRRIIKAMTGVNLEAANPGASTGLDSYDASKQASNDFKGRYSIQGVGERISELQDIKLFYDSDIASLQEEIEELSKTKKDRKENKEKIKELKALRDDNKKHSADLLISIKALQKELIRMSKLNQNMDHLAGEIQTLNDAIDLLNAQLAGNTDSKEGRKLKASLAKKQKALKKAIKAYDKADNDTLRQYGKLGFLNLPEEIVEAMQKAGFSWGGDWKGHKDFMHFEID